jgi:hypothetical protein
MTVASTPLDQHHRCPGASISHALWLYCRFPLSHRAVVERVCVRGRLVSSEAIRPWCRMVGQASAHALRPRRPQPGDPWPLDAVCLTIYQKRLDRWRAVDQDGPGLDRLGQRRWHPQTAQRKRSGMAVHVCRARAPLPRRVWSHGATCSTAPAAVVCSRVPSQHAAKLPGVGRDHGPAERGLRAAGVRSRPALARWCPQMGSAGCHEQRRKNDARNASVRGGRDTPLPLCPTVPGPGGGGDSSCATLPDGARMTTGPSSVTCRVDGA